MEKNINENGIKKDIRNYEKLEKINKSDEFNDFFNLQIETVANKILWAFVGDNVKDWDSFCKVRGEVVAYLYPIQEVRGAEQMKKQLVDSLNQFYSRQV